HRIGQTRSRMDADQRQLAGRLRIGVGHAGGVAFMTRRDQLDASPDQRMRYLEVGRAQQAEAPPRPIARDISGDDGRYSAIVSHSLALIKTWRAPAPPCSGGRAAPQASRRRRRNL